MRRNYLFNAWRQEDNNRALVRTLWIFIGLLLVINLSLWVGWKSVPTKQRFYIPPDISQGATVKAGEVPSVTVYSFAYTMFAFLNTWSHDGEKDYFKNIQSYKNYLSEQFYRSLLTDATSRRSSGGLNRMRIMSLMPGEGYSPEKVKNLGGGSWVVYLKVHIVETISGSVVKDIDMQYPLIIRAVNSPISINPWGFSLAGYSTEPTRIKTRI